MAYQMNELLGIMKQIVLPRVFADPEFFPGIVLHLRLVDLFDYLLERLGHVLLKVRRLPVIYWSLYELEAHLRAHAFCQLAFLRVELNDLIRQAVDLLLQRQFICLEHK